VRRRLLRVNEAVREVVSAAIASDLKDPRVGFVTVTGVETSPDLRHARVFVSVLGTEAQRAESVQALRAAHGFLQARLAGTVRLKRTPQLEFVYDETTDKAMRITALLSQHEQELARREPAEARDDAHVGGRPPADNGEEG